MGLCGYARSGKDTVADILVRDHGFTRVALADGVRELALEINPKLTDRWRLSHVLAHYGGWEGVKDSDYAEDVRGLLQRLGTGCRDLLGEYVWIDRLLRNWPDAARVVVTDVRFANEAAALQGLYGEIWRVERPGVGPANGHVSERLEFAVDRTFHNDGTVEELALNIDQYGGLR